MCSFLDEPINGLDPQGIADIRRLILELNQTGLTIIVSSHILEELSKVATRYAIIDRGEIAEGVSREELLRKCGERIELEVDEASRPSRFWNGNCISAATKWSVTARCIFTIPTRRTGRLSRRLSPEAYR
ncbi:hypothetical protein [Paenibacillus sp. S150]|uniref:hypothetical protein n=1 Tax=Paenibacillus sp. S150 TaxID=2749826 RepID=UPI001C5743A5|nr:hypothetical protein [Paenibacillus sp. S150]MBW4080150.1 hypothetical protein [Paenibacillus sp. S150]